MAEGLLKINFILIPPIHPRIFAHMCTCSHICDMRHWSLGHSAVPRISQAACGFVHLSSDCSSLPSNKFVPKPGSVVIFLTPLFRMNVPLTTFPGQSVWTSSPQIFSCHTVLICGFNQLCVFLRDLQDFQRSPFQVFSTFSRTAIMKTHASFHVSFPGPSFIKVLLPYN